VVPGEAADRRWPEDSALSVRQAFQAEAREADGAARARAFALGERVAVKVGKTPYVRFDLNDYSVPHTHVRRTLAVLADEQWVRVLDGATELARHRPLLGPPAAQIEIEAHVQRLVEHKRGRRAHRGLRPPGAGRAGSRTLLQRAAARGENLGSITAALLRLLERWGSRGAAGGHPRGAGSATCRTPTPCGWRWSAPARPAASPRRWRWCCPSTWRGATRRCARTTWARMTAAR
jgi:hypothetical protein